MFRLYNNKFNRILGLIGRIKKSRVAKLIKRSLLYNMFIMFLIIMFFLQIIFLISPKKGSVSYSGPIVNRAEIESGCANLKVVTNSFTIKLNSKDEIYSDWLGLILIPTGNDPTIYVKSSKNKLFSAYIFTPSGSYDATKIISPNLLPAPHVNTTFNYWDTFIKSKTGFVIDVEDGIKFNLTFSQIDAYARNEAGEAEKVDSYEVLDFDLKCDSTIRLITDYDDEIDEPTEYDISFIEPNKMQFVANGDFYVSYSSKENIFSSTMREIELWSDEKITCNMKYKKNSNIKLNLYGQVDKGTINGYSIFPTFLNWYYENIYFAPLTLISTLLGGIVLMKKEVESD